MLLVEEAGGRVTDMRGGAWQLDSRETLATNGIVHDAFLGVIDDIFSGRVDPLPSAVEYAKDRS